MNLSCIITTRNEAHDLLRRTVAELLQTAPDVEIILVDDASDVLPPPADLPVHKRITFPVRQGIADARAAGIESAAHDWCFLLDAHMMFPAKWKENMFSHFPATNELISTTYISCDPEFPSMLNPRAVIGGCQHNYFERLTAGGLEPMYCTPMEPQKGQCKMLHEYEVPCVIGAAYLVHKEWWNHIMGSNGLKFYGGSDHLMSVKTWLCGGKVKVYGDLLIAHYMPGNAVRDTPLHIQLANKMHIARCMLSDAQFQKLLNVFARYGQAFPLALQFLQQIGCDQIAAACKSRYTVALADWERKFKIKPIEYWFEKFGVK